MKTPMLKLSSKYQVVIPKMARKKLGITTVTGQQFSVISVTEDEIVFRKSKTLDDFLGAYTSAFPKNATGALRRIRDNEWGE